jgi:hypothetical protein
MDYTFTISGNLQFHGCPKVDLDTFYLSNFAVGDTAYDKISARKGKIEAIVVRKIVFRQRGGLILPLYIDTLNGLYNEVDLVTHDEAVEIATAFFNRKLDTVNALINKLNC